MELIEKLNNIVEANKRQHQYKFPFFKDKIDKRLKTKKIPSNENKQLNNQIFGFSAEVAICELRGISHGIKSNQYSTTYVKNLKKFFSLDENFEVMKLIKTAKEYIGENQSPVDFILKTKDVETKRNHTLSIKTAGNYRISPQTIGQNTLKTFFNNLITVGREFSPNLERKIKGLLIKHNIELDNRIKDDTNARINAAKNLIFKFTIRLILESVRNSIYKTDYTIFVSHKKYVPQYIEIFKQREIDDVIDIIRTIRKNFKLVSTKEVANWEASNTFKFVLKNESARMDEKTSKLTWARVKGYSIINFQINKKNEIITRINWQALFTLIKDANAISKKDIKALHIR